MRGLLVRVGCDQSEGGGFYNGPVDGATREFAYVPIPETGICHAGFEKSYRVLQPTLSQFGFALPERLASQRMHLDPDFDYLTYGDQGQRAIQISSKLVKGDLLVFYAGLADCKHGGGLVYAIIGLYVIDVIIQAKEVPDRLWGENAHTRRCLAENASDIVVRGKPGVSGRLEHCLPIGVFRTSINHPLKRPCYRVLLPLLDVWGGLSVADGFLQRSARLPEFNEAERFYDWFNNCKPSLVSRNN